MRKLVTRAANIVLRPESEWIAIAHERSAWREVCWRYLVPLALISPLAYGCSVLIGGEGAFRQFADFEAALHYALLSAFGGFLVSPLSVILIAIMHCMFLFYLGLHHVVKVPCRDAAECTAIVVAAGIMLSTVAGYYASAAGLFPHM